MTVYCLLVNRTHFQREQLTQGHQQSVCSTRALFCELIANRILRRFYEDNTGAQGLLLLSQILVGGFDPFQGAPADVVAESSQLSWTIQMRSGYRRKLPALEIAIISESKVFLSVSKTLQTNQNSALGFPGESTGANQLSPCAQSISSRGTGY